MKKLFTITLALLTFILISCGKAKTDANGCYYDIDDAAAVANKKNQDIMLIISVDEDDTDDFDFMNKVVRDQNFKKEIAENYAVVYMDFSKKNIETSLTADDADAAAKKQVEENEALFKKNSRLITLLEVQDTPIVYLLSKEKYFIKGFFYDEDNRTLEGFKNMIAEKSSLIDEMHKMIYQTKIGTAEEKVNAIDKLFEATSPNYRLFLYDLVDSVKKIDPSNTSGLLGKYIYEAAAIKSDMAFIDKDVRTAVQAYIDISEETLIPAETRQIGMYTAAYMAAKTELDPIPVVIGYLEKSISLAPESEQVPAIRRVIAALEAQATAETKAE